MKIFSKGLIVFLSIIILFVFSGLGVLAIPKPAKAFPVFDWKKLLENILLAIWKFAIYPLLQKIIITAITKGEWFLTEDELKKWAIQDLAFQTANAVLVGISGVSLCAKINQNIRLALNKLSADMTKHTPPCTFDQSEMLGLLAMDPEKRSETLRKKLFQSIHVSVQGGNNDMGLTLDAFTSIVDQSSNKSDKAGEELSMNKLLSTRDCSCDIPRLKKLGYKDPEGSDKICIDKMILQSFRPQLCKKTSIDGQLSETIKKNGGVAGDQFGQTLKSQVLLDLIVLAKMAISAAVETHVMNPLQKWLASNLTSKQPVLAPSYTRSGENRLIEFPIDSLNMNNLPPPPDLIEETP